MWFSAGPSRVGPGVAVGLGLGGPAGPLIQEVALVGVWSTGNQKDERRQGRPP